MDEPTKLIALLPAWVCFQRMGHQQDYGHLQHVTGTLCLLTSPSVDGDDDHHPIEAETQIVQVGGPSFWGCEIISRESAMAHLTAQRGRIWRNDSPGYVMDDEDDDEDDDESVPY